MKLLLLVYILEQLSLDVGLLRNLAEHAALGCVLSLRFCQIDSGDKPYKNLAVLQAFDQTNVVFVDATSFDTDPLVGLDIVALSFVVLVDRSHLIGGQQGVLVENEMQICAGFLHVDFFESLNVDVALSGVRAGH